MSANKTRRPAIGQPLGGGFFAGRILISGIAYALIVAPKALGEHADTVWHTSYDRLKDAESFNDGLANTKAMSKAGSALAKWMLDLEIDGFGGWYLPAQDELEILYRNLKPTTDDSSGWARSGINLSALPPTYPYTHEPAKQTKAKAFRAGGAEAFDPVAYWTSTQHAGHSSDAWCQYFSHGYQNGWTKNRKLRARAVRRLKL